MPKFRKNEEEVELEDDDERPDPAGKDEDEDSDDEDSKPKSKLKKKTKAPVEVEEDEEPTPKKKVATAKKKVVETEDEEEETSKPKAKAKSGKTKAKKERKPRATILGETGLPYGEESMIGKAFLMARKGVPVEKLRAFIEKSKESKKGGSWVLTRLRSGHRHDGKATWKVVDDGKESGVLKISFKTAA